MTPQGVRNFAKVFMEQRPGRESNLASMKHQSDALSTAPPRHPVTSVSGIKTITVMTKDKTVKILSQGETGLKTSHHCQKFVKYCSRELKRRPWRLVSGVAQWKNVGLCLAIFPWPSPNHLYG